MYKNGPKYHFSGQSQALTYSEVVTKAEEVHIEETLHQNRAVLN
jgi:hypothetical protein